MLKVEKCRNRSTSDYGLDFGLDKQPLCHYVDYVLVTRFPKSTNSSASHDHYVDYVLVTRFPKSTKSSASHDQAK